MYTRETGSAPAQRGGPHRWRSLWDDPQNLRFQMEKYRNHFTAAVSEDHACSSGWSGPAGSGVYGIAMSLMMTINTVLARL